MPSADPADFRSLAGDSLGGLPCKPHGDHVKKNILLALVCLTSLAASTARAQKSGDTGVGIVAGAPTGITGKMWLDGRQAVDLGLGWNSEVTVYGDYLWHAWDVIPQPSEGKIPVYLGVGAQGRMYHEAEFGVRAVGGIAYWLPRHPVEIFAEIVPVFHLTRNTGVGVDGAVGVRYYFH